MCDTQQPQLPQHPLSDVLPTTKMVHRSDMAQGVTQYHTLG